MQIVMLIPKKNVGKERGLEGRQINFNMAYWLWIMVKAIKILRLKGQVVACADPNIIGQKQLLLAKNKIFQDWKKLLE
jgi:hypothetical protein